MPNTPKKHQSAYVFSDLGLFLFGSGFALFVALLGWSDQIRGLAKETRDLQSEFVRKYDLSLADLLRAVRAETPDERFAALTSLMQSRKLDTAAAVNALPLFRTWDAQSTFIERLYAFKYGLTIALAVTFFIAGFCSVVTILSDLLLLIAPGILLLAVFVLIVWTNLLERKLHAVLTTMLEAM